MGMFYTVLFIAVIVGMYSMIIADRRWISVTGIILSLLLVIFFSMRLGYSLHECGVESFPPGIEMRV
jgi:hypothetical protein